MKVQMVMEAVDEAMVGTGNKVVTEAERKVVADAVVEAVVVVML